MARDRRGGVRRIMREAALAILLGAGIAHGAEDPFAAAANKTPEQLRTGIEDAHPAVYYLLALKLFAAGQRDDAVFWYYAGQLRYRFHLRATPTLDPSGDPALFASLSEVVGRSINEYAFGDLDTLRATLDRVLRWDDRSPNGFTRKDRQAHAWADVRSGLRRLIEYIRDNADTIRRQRAANGLENRH